MSNNDTIRHSDFSLSQARSIVGHLFKLRPEIYWCDFLLSYIVGIFCFQQVRGGNLLVPHQGFTGTWSQTFCFFVSSLLFYRCGLFIHEVVHHRNGKLPVFRVVWNLLCGIPFLTPSFVYYMHIDHHRRAHYGTKRDGEYMPMTHRSPWFMLFYLSWSFMIPLVVVARFLVLSPIAWISPAFRKWIHNRCSSMVMDPSYIRPLPTKRTLQTIRLQEACCFLWIVGLIVVPPLFLDRWAIPFAVHAYLMSVTIVFLNSIRTLGSHRWQNEGGEMSFVQQLEDSVNYPHAPILSEIWGPVGTRYHALHHLFPTMPYHSLGRAHRLLMANLPADSVYRQTVARSLTSNLIDLVRTVLSRNSEKSPNHQQPYLHSAQS
ncbi:MAG: fatty acid desaturase [Planctomycetales bacterium]|nr:fatty acid desaturase [Planctomycetales bacterium]